MTSSDVLHSSCTLEVDETVPENLLYINLSHVQEHFLTCNNSLGMRVVKIYLFTLRSVIIGEFSILTDLPRNFESSHAPIKFPIKVHYLHQSKILRTELLSQSQGLTVSAPPFIFCCLNVLNVRRQIHVHALILNELCLTVTVGPLRHLF